MVLTLLWFAVSARAEVSVQAAVDQQEVLVGETFTLQVQVEGSDAPPEPKVSAITDFQVESRGGQQNSSESVTIVNGRMNRVSHRGYVFNYGLTPKKEGRLLIPALTLTIDNQTYQTQAISILAKKPVETNDFKLRLALDKNRAYVGEPVTLTVTWYIGKDVNGFTFTLPILSDPRFSLSDGPTAGRNPNQGNVVRIPAAGGEILAEKSNGVLDGQNFLTVSFSKTLIAKEPGVLSLPQATVSCQALSNHRQGARDPFSGMSPDDFFGRTRQAFRTEVVPSNEPTLEVLPLPAEGRPADFTGLVGAYSLAVTASPTEVKVGDPITLTIQIAGPAAAEASLPSLGEALGVNDFKVPNEMAPGEGSAELKTFTQTVRAKHAGVRQVPTLRLSYFNPTSGRYETASSQPVALAVADAKMVTAQDAEGGDPGLLAKKELKAVKGGITYNYEGPEILISQTAQRGLGLNGGWYALLALPPGIFLLILIGTLVRRYGSKDPEGRAARHAYRRLQVALDGIAAQGAGDYQAMGLAVREYLGAKLRCNPAALTYADVEPLLVKVRVRGECLASLRQVMEQCEAFQYAGPSAGSDDMLRLCVLVRQVASELERVKM
jgi:hypothetical protein